MSVIFDFVRLLPALLTMLLLVCSIPGADARHARNELIGQSDGLVQPLRVQPLKIQPFRLVGRTGSEHEYATAPAYLEVDDENDDNVRVTAPGYRILTGDDAPPLLPRIQLIAAALSHRHCAAPPTGPPHA